MGAGASTEQESIEAQRLGEKACVSSMSDEQREDFERKLKALYDAHGGNSIFKESSEKQKEVLEILERETEKLHALGLEATSDFRKRRLSYSIDLRDKDQIDAHVNGSDSAATRRSSAKFRSPQYSDFGSTSNRRINVAPTKAESDREDGASPNAEFPPFPDNVLGTFSYHGIEPKYFGAGFTSKINQDRGCVSHPYVDDDARSLYCVFDGHGERGDEVSEFVLESVVQKLETHPDLESNPEKALASTFLATDDELAASSVDSFFSGTTAIVVYRVGNVLYTANAGDSRAVLATRIDQKAKTAEGAAIRPVPLSVDQNPDLPGERERIESMGGFVSDPPEEGLSARVWLDRNMTRVGLAMARSIGDHAVKPVGVIAEPQVTKHVIGSGDEFLIVASDGVWEFISSEEAISLVAAKLEECDSAKDACKALIDQAVSLWKENEGDYRDDITAVVMRISRYDNCD